MAQFNFLGTWKDSWSILAAILRPRDVCFIPDLKYEQPQPYFLMTLDDIREHCLSGHRKLFISSDLFTSAPPVLRRIEAGVNEGRYFVDESEGGPLLVLTLPSCYCYDADGNPAHAFEEEGKLHLGCGTLFRHRQYQKPQTQMWEATPDDLKSGYKEVLRRMKTQLVRHQFHEPIWIGLDALHQVREDNATIHGFGLD